MRYSISAFVNVVGILSCFIRVHISSACVGGGGGDRFFKMAANLISSDYCKEQEPLHMCTCTCTCVCVCAFLHADSH